MAFNAERVGLQFEKEILKYWTGTELAKNVVIDADNLAAYNTKSDGRLIVEAGTLLEVSGSDTDEVQKITIDGTPDAGTFKLSWNDEETATIAATASAANVETALEALSNLETTDVAVTGSVAAGFTVTFGGAYSGLDVSQLQVSANTLTESSVAVDAFVETTTTPLQEKVKPAAVSGVSAGNIVGILAYTVEFFDESTSTDHKFDEPAAAFFRGCLFDKQKLIAWSANASAVATALPNCEFL